MEIPFGAPILVVKDPWITMLVEGTKTMEIRGFRCKKQKGERVHFSKSGTGTIIGSARFVESVYFESEEEMRAEEGKHCVPSTSKVPYKKIHGWVFADAKKMHPIKYNVKRGSVVWRKYEPVTTNDEMQPIQSSIVY